MPEFRRPDTKLRKRENRFEKKAEEKKVPKLERKPLIPKNPKPRKPRKPLDLTPEERKKLKKFLDPIKKPEKSFKEKAKDFGKKAIEVGKKVVKYTPQGQIVSIVKKIDKAAKKQKEKNKKVKPIPSIKLKNGGRANLRGGGRAYGKNS